MRKRTKNASGLRQTFPFHKRRSFEYTNVIMKELTEYNLIKGLEENNGPLFVNVYGAHHKALLVVQTFLRGFLLVYSLSVIL